MRRVAILGMGARGTRWAKALADSGWRVSAFDPEQPNASPPPDRETTISATVQNSEWIILCLPERLELLQSVLRRVQAEASDDSGIIVTTKGFDVVEVQGCSLRPSDIVVVTHDQSGLSLSVSERNSEEIKVRTMAFLAELSDLPAFAPTSRSHSSRTIPGAESA